MFCCEDEHENDYFPFCTNEEKKLEFFLICPLSPGGGGGGLRALADMSVKNVSFFGRLLLQNNSLTCNNRFVEG